MKEKEEFSLKNLYLTALQKFNPFALCEYLKVEGGVNIVDKKMALKKNGDSTLFIIALNNVYGWNYEGEFKSVTAYLETDGKDIYGGAYDLKLRTPLSRRLVASTIENEEQRMKPGNNSAFTPYIYTGEKLGEMIEKLTKST